MHGPLYDFALLPLIKIVVVLAVLLLIVAYLTFFERKLLAYMQVRIGPNRVGPRGWLQPIADGLKLFVKEDLVPGTAEKFVFLLAPCLIIVPALLVWSVIPFTGETTVFGLLSEPIPAYLTDINIGILFVLGVSSVGVFGIILGGWASNSKFSLMGGLRSAAQMVSYEVPMATALLLAVNKWHIVLSRAGYRVILLPLFGTLVLLGLARIADRKADSPDFQQKVHALVESAKLAVPEAQAFFDAIWSSNFRIPGLNWGRATSLILQHRFDEVARVAYS